MIYYLTLFYSNDILAVNNSELETSGLVKVERVRCWAGFGGGRCVCGGRLGVWVFLLLGFGFWGEGVFLTEKGKKGRKDTSNQRPFFCKTYDLFVSSLLTFLPKFIVSNVNSLMLK